MQQKSVLAVIGLEYVGQVQKMLLDSKQYVQSTSLLVAVFKLFPKDIASIGQHFLLESQKKVSIGGFKLRSNERMLCYRRLDRMFVIQRCEHESLIFL